MDREVIAQKLDSLQRCLRRITEKCPAEVSILAQDLDLQDIITVNLSRAVQLCVDIGAHLVAELPGRSPDTMGQTFEILAEQGVVSEDLALRLKKAVGFRNIAVHNYEAIDWAIVFAIAQHHLNDFMDFARVVNARLTGRS